ncbi:MAG: hypothetical protein J6I47_09470 [Ruminococcus sp.]|nr:hypothetical protein [Ruminococcus sp.]
MLKGVNKNIIEVNNPDSIYFEKAVFYLRPHVRELPAEITNDEIEKYIMRIGIECQHIHRPFKIKLLAAIVIIMLSALAAVLAVLF